MYTTNCLKFYFIDVFLVGGRGTFHEVGLCSERIAVMSNKIEGQNGGTTKVFICVFMLFSRY